MKNIKPYLILLSVMLTAPLWADSLTSEIKQKIIFLGIHPFFATSELHQTASFISNKGNTTDLSLRELYWQTYQDEQDLKRLMETQLENGSWPEINMKDDSRSNWQPGNFASLLLQLSRAYRTPGSSFYLQKSLSNVLHRGLDFWFSTKHVCKNWWYNDIYIPRTLGLLFLFIEEELTPAEKAEALVVMNHSGFRMTGQNKVWLAGNVVLKALLTNNESLLKGARDTIASEIFQTLGEGIQPDFTFHQHGPQQQLGNYGLAYISSMAYYANVFGNSPIAFTQTQLDLLRRFLLEGESTVVWRGRMDISACNRQLFKQTQRGKALSLCVAASLMGQADSSFSTDYSNLIGRNRSTIASVEPSFSNHFWRSDLTVYRNSDHYLSIRSCSPRLIGTEFTNNENKKGHFISDGLTLLMRRGDEYEDIFPIWDWNRLPGVTAPLWDTIVPKTKTDNYRNPNPFVGGLTHLKHGISTFSLDRNNVTAKKSWFYSNGLLVCMGTNIHSTTGQEIVTGVNQVLKKTSSVAFDKSGTRSIFNDTTVSFGRIKAVWHDSIAFVFPDQKGVMLSDKTQQGDWHDIADPYPPEKVSASISKLWISHGKNAARSSSYKYLVYPGMTLEKLEELLRSKSLPIMVNRSDVQLVQFGKNGPVEVVFHTPSNVCTFSKKEVLQALNPGLVMVEHAINGRLMVTVADPSGSLSVFRIVLSGRFTSPFATYQAGKKQTELVIPLPGKGDAGKAVTVLLKGM